MENIANFAHTAAQFVNGFLPAQATAAGDMVVAAFIPLIAGWLCLVFWSLGYARR